MCDLMVKEFLPFWAKYKERTWIIYNIWKMWQILFYQNFNFVFEDPKLRH